ncbi:uncharacterized protein LOC123875832 [Maniola jurtina]|uniref:uncharacterized protein LOC123875832 n=1 Tax=Maniola jurtina TaxID=191418 RepID=UPI001E686EAB|nr:uncharacterized protein LOC123875832 [Maniola jurtina]
MVLLSPSINGLRKLLSICDQFAKEHGLKYNVAKTEMLIFKADDIKDDKDMERERRALSVRANMIARRFARCSDDVKLWTKFTKRSYNALRIQYNNAFRILMKHPRFCSAKAMFAAAGVPDFFAILRARTASFWERLRHSTNSILCAVNEDLSIKRKSLFFMHIAYYVTVLNVGTKGIKIQ